MTGSPAPWWHGATLYQLHVRSWLDTNGDGCGDLPGVTARPDYLSWLGVDGIWLSPTMASPDHDWGYDVCDYFEVHPDLGTLERPEGPLIRNGPGFTSSLRFSCRPRGKHSGLYRWARLAPERAPTSTSRGTDHDGPRRDA
jgi:Alpha amylase, catalytic domain